ncbi:MAG: hypothetical protein QM705_13685 [Ancrocorticia sp.]
MDGFWETIEDLAFPRWCAGCSVWDEYLCERCRAGFGSGWTRVEGRAPYLQRVRSWDEGTSGLLYPGDDEAIFPVYALADYDGEVRKAIVSWKNSVSKGLTDAMVDLVAQRAGEIELGTAVSVVPAPSSWRRRHDGRLVARHIARGLCAGINGGVGASGSLGSGSELAVVDDVLTQGSTVSQLVTSRGRARLSGRGRKAREIRVRRVPSHPQVILVDDVLTSGATLAGCAAALAREGSEVCAAFVLAAARDPRGTR